LKEAARAKARRRAWARKERSRRRSRDAATMAGSSPTRIESAAAGRAKGLRK